MKSKKLFFRKALYLAGLIALIFCFAFTACGPDEGAVTGVTLNKTALALDSGASETLIASVQPDTAANKAVTWDSDDDKVATVDGNGKVTAVAAGTATITVTTDDGGFKDTCTVTVTDVTLSLNKTSLTLVKGKSEFLTATVSPSGTTLTWASDRPDIATVDASSSGLSGDVFARAAGTANITVQTTGGKTATCTVTVMDPSGNYEGSYTNSSSKTIKETIVLSSDNLKITDDVETAADKIEFLDFSITKWETAATPSAQSSAYPTAFKITGKITGARPIVSTGSTNLYGSLTAPGFAQSDITNGTECWMYIYINSAGTSFIKSAFSKAGKDNGTAPVTYTSSNLAIRTYSKETP